jgi:hypothetical protein
MLRFRLLAALAGALFAGLSVATIAAARISDDDGAPPAYVYTFGAGDFGPACWQTHSGPFCAPFDYSFRLLGIRPGAGSPWGIFERRNNDTGGVFRGRVTCMTVEGNHASIGGILTATPGQPGIVDGDPFIIYVEDNGPVGSPTRDQISVLAILPANDPDRPLMPERFPEVCPSADSLYGYAPLTSGDITVADA